MDQRALGSEEAESGVFQRPWAHSIHLQLGASPGPPASLRVCLLPLPGFLGSHCSINTETHEQMKVVFVAHLESKTTVTSEAALQGNHG